MNHINLSAYDNFEKFNDGENIIKYRKDKLESIDKNVNFIKDEFSSDTINVVELGSGNGKMLIGLNKINLLKNGLGLEVSDSRNKFANSWFLDENMTNCQVINRDITTYEFDELTNIDLYIGLDIIYHFMEPIKKGSALSQLKKIYTSLKDGGKVIFEFCILDRYLDIRHWEEFDEPDPWQYSLWDCRYNRETNFLDWNKIFLSRDGKKTDKQSIILDVISPSMVLKMFEDAGFKDIVRYNNWERMDYTETEFEYILIAKK